MHDQSSTSSWQASPTDRQCSYQAGSHPSFHQPRKSTKYRAFSITACSALFQCSISPFQGFHTACLSVGDDALALMRSAQLDHSLNRLVTQDHCSQCADTLPSRLTGQPNVQTLYRVSIRLLFGLMILFETDGLIVALLGTPTMRPCAPSSKNSVRSKKL